MRTIPAALRQRLACPTCHGALEDRPNELFCTHCDFPFPVQDAVPIMIDAESRAKLTSTRAQAENDRIRQKVAKRRVLSAIVRITRPPHPFLFTAGPKKRAAFSALVEQAAADGQPFTVDIGSGILGGQNTSGLSERVFKGTVGMEIDRTPDTTLAGDAHKLPFATGTVDGVLIQGVLEHVEDPVRIAGEIERVLKPGAAVYVSIPFIQHYHQEPEDYRRYTLTGLRQLLANFEEVDAGVLAGPSSALCDMLTEWFAVWFDHPVLYWGAKWVAGWVLVPIRYMDHALSRRKRAHTIAGALYFLGRRRSA